uniref:SnoaL-like domain-containing protein n=1 Tax=Chlamydomonas leiostraca TaxID=1034604 RepID=A0A7S0RF83_9CHLO|mmetsp:Transcript_21395/g.54491  ORF Transcript_21395/g.54491 Transcript_21395/m.54491 type:complete len:197 (+) Transcript_21395:50-640(+)
MMLLARGAARGAVKGCVQRSLLAPAPFPARQHGTRTSTVATALTAEDRVNIMELCHRFDRAINQLDQAAAVALFLPEAKLHTPRGVVTGAPNILAFFKSVEPMARGNRHLTLNMVIDEAPVTVDGAQACAHAHGYRMLHKAAAPPLLMATGLIEDVLVKTGEGQWRFAERKFIMDPPAEAPAASTASSSGSSSQTK